MSLTARNMMLLAAAFVTWALLGSIFYGIQWSSTQEPRWVELILGGQIRWLSWIAYAALIICLSRKIENSKLEIAPKILSHTIMAIAVVLAQALYLRLIRPVPPMLLYGRTYAEVFNRFRFTDYLTYQAVFIDLAVYLAIAIPTTLLVRQTPIRTDSPSIPDTEAPNPDIATISQDSVPTFPNSMPLEQLQIRLADKTIFLPVSEIEWVESADYYVNIRARGSKLLHRESIQNLEAQLPQGQFLRVHRRALVNSSMIKELVSIAESRWAVRMKSGDLVEVSRRRRRQVESALSSPRL